MSIWRKKSRRDRIVRFFKHKFHRTTKRERLVRAMAETFTRYR